MSPGDRLRLARLNAGYKSVAKAAVALCMSESSYRAHENGQNSFTPEQAQRYAAAFDVEAAWLLYGDPDEDDGTLAYVGAVTLSSSAILAALVQTLHAKGGLTDDETLEVYESALLLLESQQAGADETTGYGHVVAMARELIEQHLRPWSLARITQYQALNKL